VGDQLGQPIEGLEGFGCAAVFGSIDHFCLSIRSTCGRNIDHTLLEETGTDNVAGQILKALVVVGTDGGTAIYVEAAVAPGKHIFNDRIGRCCATDSSPGQSVGSVSCPGGRHGEFLQWFPQSASPSKKLLSLQDAESLEDLPRWVNFARRLPPKVGHFCMPADTRPFPCVGLYVSLAY
jgi:hypothetical protein